MVVVNLLEQVIDFMRGQTLGKSRDNVGLVSSGLGY